MPTPSAAAWLMGAALVAAAGSAAQSPGGALRPTLGQPVGAADAARADPVVHADGRGLPAGRGTALAGRPLYDARCASCHGAGGSGGPGGKLVGRAPLQDNPTHERTIGQYWPHAATLFHTIRRTMPLEQPGSLSDDEAYALAAFLLHANGIVGEREVIDAATLPRVRMPNRDGFVRAEDAPRGD